mmetsp:Transcript_52000/g.97272  ORF Transcript_52000/g.97272 Transcript_52000/m.97272 type:complete len:150 (-) Transcript_52000:51-500(-)
MLAPRLGRLRLGLALRHGRFCQGQGLATSIRAVAVPCKGMAAFQTRSFAAASEEMELMKRRKRLTWRAKSRGWLELDVLMGTFVEKHISDFDDEKLDLLEEVLELENPDLFKWFTKQVAVPDELLQENEVMRLMMEYVKSDHASDFSIK